MDNSIRLYPFSPEHSRAVLEIRPEPPALYRLHYNAYWIGQSVLHRDIYSVLIADGSGSIRGFAAWGRCYIDEYLMFPAEGGVAELYHLVIDPRFQRRGIGAAAVRQICRDADGEGYRQIRVAHHPDDPDVAGFYHNLGFAPLGENFDGDPWLNKDLQ
jgi:GNAT superfamily N-acetyltransferase